MYRNREGTESEKYGSNRAHVCVLLGGGLRVVTDSFSPVLCAQFTMRGFSDHSRHVRMIYTTERVRQIARSHHYALA